MKYHVHITIRLNKGTLETTSREGYLSSHHALMTRLDDIAREMRFGKVKTVSALSATIMPDAA